MQRRPPIALTAILCALLPVLSAGSSATAGPAQAPTAESAPAPPPEEAFDWTRGNWKGVRRHGADGSEAEMRLTISPLLEGAGLTTELRVAREGGLYRARLLQAMESDTGRWYQVYINDVDRRFVRSEGEILETGEKGAVHSVWTRTDPDGGRLSKLDSEYLPPDRWRRTQSVSDDGGATWRVLWTDELQRLRGF